MAVPEKRHILAGLWAAYTVVTHSALVLAGAAFGLTCAPLLTVNKPGDLDNTPLFAALTAGFAAVVFVLALVSLLLCWGLYRGYRWGRIGILLLAVLNLANIPFGTALAIFTFVTLKNQLDMGENVE